MTRLYDDPARFADDMLAGFLDAHSSRVVGVRGGVVRAAAQWPGKVAVVIGGGSGHYPAFCGLVGPGFADGAVVGNVFTSPSATDATSVARAASACGGVLLCTGNYTGDVINFDDAVLRLAGEGIDARYVVVTDDIASAIAAVLPTRRGIAGDFPVMKAASAAAEGGYDLDAVEGVARLANDLTRSLGVAFDGCTIPGEREPLFTVPTGRMGVGLGIHGEPGIGEEAMTTAAELAARLVDGVLGDAPAGAGGRVAALLNGLGRTKYEELFVVWRTASRLLRERGIEVVEPEVGELVTSLDMAGCSLTLMWLDDELERWWRAPADTPAYRKGSVKGPARDGRPTRTEATRPGPRNTVTVSGEAGRSCAATVAAALTRVTAAVVAQEHELGRLDAVAGDGDHGRGMVRGASAATAAAADHAARGAGGGSTLAAAGEAWAATAGGTSGALWGAALEAAGRRLGDHVADAGTVVAAVRDGLAAIIRVGKAKPGDKTMLDALAPFADTLSTAVGAGLPLSVAWTAAAGQADEAALATAVLRPQVGRARPLAERSVGTPDPGAVSMALCLRAIGDVLDGDVPDGDTHGRAHDHAPGNEPGLQGVHDG